MPGMGPRTEEGMRTSKANCGFYILSQERTLLPVGTMGEHPMHKVPQNLEANGGREESKVK